MGAEQAANIAARVENLRREKERKDKEKAMIVMADVTKQENDLNLQKTWEPGDRIEFQKRKDAARAAFGLAPEPAKNMVEIRLSQLAYEGGVNVTSGLWRVDKDNRVIPFEDKVIAELGEPALARMLAGFNNQAVLAAAQKQAEQPAETLGAQPSAKAQVTIPGAQTPTGSATPQAATGGQAGEATTQPTPQVGGTGLSIRRGISALIAQHKRIMSESELLEEYDTFYKRATTAREKGASYEEILPDLQVMWGDLQELGRKPNNEPMPKDWGKTWGTADPASVKNTRERFKQQMATQILGAWLSQAGRAQTPEAKQEFADAWAGSLNSMMAGAAFTGSEIVAMLPNITEHEKVDVANDRLRGENLAADLKAKQAKYPFIAEYESARIAHEKAATAAAGRSNRTGKGGLTAGQSATEQWRRFRAAVDNAKADAKTLTTLTQLRDKMVVDMNDPTYGSQEFRDQTKANLPNVEARIKEVRSAVGRTPGAQVMPSGAINVNVTAPGGTPYVIPVAPPTTTGGGTRRVSKFTEETEKDLIEAASQLKRSGLSQTQFIKRIKGGVPSKKIKGHPNYSGSELAKIYKAAR